MTARFAARIVVAAVAIAVAVGGDAVAGVPGAGVTGAGATGAGVPSAGIARVAEATALPGTTPVPFVRPLRLPIATIAPADLRDTYTAVRGDGRHEALDIAAPRGTPIVAVDDGRIAKLFRSVRGGLTVYQFDPDARFAYYYAHLDRYADDLREGATVRAGDVIGYVGTTGNTPPNAPHLHFAIFEVGPDRAWWRGTAINPYPILRNAPR